MARVQTLCMWDDHEIHNDYGTFAKEKDSSTLDYMLGLCARQAYWEYQRQLWDDLPQDPAAVASEYHAHVWGKIGVMFTDCRGSQSFYHDPEDAEHALLTSTQWDLIEAALAPGGTFDKCTALVTVCTSPLVCLSTFKSECCGR